VLKKSIAALKSLSIFLSILFLFLVASYVLVTRIALHFLPDYKEELVRFLNETTQQTIDISSISSRWDGFDPVLQVSGLTIQSNDPLHIKNISFYFSFTQSLFALQPKFERILIEHTELTAKQVDDGHWEFLGFSTKDYEHPEKPLTTNSNESLNILSLFNGSTINIKNLNAVIHTEKGKVRTLRLPTLNVNYSNDQLFASGKILQKQGEKALLNFSLRGSGLLSSETLKGVLYVEARSSEFFDGFLDAYDWNKVSIQDIEGSSRAWISFEGSEISSVYGDLQVSEINWRADDKLQPPLHNLVFSYLWKSTPLNKQLIIDNFAFEWAETQCHPVDLDLNINDIYINVLMDKINVKCVNDLALAMGFLPEDLHKRLVISKANGYLKNLDLTILRPTPANIPLATPENHSVFDTLSSSKEPSQKNSFIFEAMLEEINIEAYEGTPSLKNLDGYIYADNQSGFVSFLSDDFELGFPTLFLEPWEIQRAEGHVSWALDGNDVSVFSDGLRLWREDNSLIYGDFVLTLNDDQHEDVLSLAIGMQDILIQDAVKFVPYHEVSNGLYTWLSDSLIAGAVKNGIYYGYGSIETISAENSFTSSIYLQSDHGVVQFEPDWPYLEELDADIIIQNAQLGIEAQHATIAGSGLNNLKAFMPEAPETEANFLNITTSAQLDSKAVDYWLLESPIANNTKDILDQLLINTSAETHINLRIPVSEAANSHIQPEIEYSVNTMVENGVIVHKPSDLTFKEVSGLLSVDSKKGVNAKGINAKLFGEQSTLDISTRYHYDKAKNPELRKQLTKINLKGQLASSDLFKYFEATKPASLEGSLKYVAELSLSNEEKKYPLLTIKSDLKGISCQCPAPFSKAIHEKEDLSLSLLLKPEQIYLDASLKSKHLPAIDAELMFIKDQPVFGEILIGGASLKSNESKGINIAASLSLANLENWINFVSTLIDTGPTASSKDESILKQVQLDIKNLDGFGYLFQKTNILIKPHNQQWVFDINGNNIKGKVFLPKDESKFILDFDTLNLVSLDKLLNASQDGAGKEPEGIDPRKIPNLAFSAKKLMLENRSIGAWKFDVEPDASGSIIRAIKGQIKGSTISGQLNWRYTPELQSTIATFDVVGDDITAIFEAFDLPVLFSSNKYRSDFVLHWPQAPTEFDLHYLSGNISLSLEDGFLKTEDQKTAGLRLFGVLNTESIKRRLKLDFSDLYKSGVGFDSFVAKASIDQGLMTLSEPLVIDGPAGKYVLNGRSDLATKVLDIDMLVELPFSQNVPLAALVLGAPQIGGLVWVADKLLGEPLSALTTSRYDITGTWDQPTVNLKQAINASKKDRSNEKGKRNIAK
jgi:uncharacterized protein (TIGR02099 family)